jgi:ABC-type antimicrobial peptide transport system permease subunit
MNRIFDHIWKNRKVNLFSFATIFTLTIVFAVTLGAGRGYHKIYQDVGGSGILAVFEGNVACPYISLVPEQYRDIILQVPHVTDVAGEVRQRYTYGKDKNLTLTSMSPDKLLAFKDIQITDKELGTFKNEKNGALVGKKIFNFFDWELGQEVISAGLVFKVSGVFEQPLSVYESMVVLHKEYLQEITSKRGYVTSFLVKTDLTPDGDVSGVIRDIESIFKDHPSKIVCRSEDELWLAIKASQGNLGDIILVLGISLGILLAVLHINNALLTLKRKRTELQELQQAGASKRAVTARVSGETAFVSAFSGIVAVLVAYVALFSHPYVGSDMFHPPIYIDSQVVVVVALASLLSGGLAALATIPAAGKVARGEL